MKKLLLSLGTIAAVVAPVAAVVACGADNSTDALSQLKTQYKAQIKKYADDADKAGLLAKLDAIKTTDEAATFAQTPEMLSLMTKAATDALGKSALSTEVTSELDTLKTNTIAQLTDAAAKSGVDRTAELAEMTAKINATQSVAELKALISANGGGTDQGSTEKTVTAGNMEFAINHGTGFKVAINMFKAGETTISTVRGGLFSDNDLTSNEDKVQFLMRNAGYTKEQAEDVVTKTVNDNVAYLEFETTPMLDDSVVESDPSGQWVYDTKEAAYNHVVDATFKSRNNLDDTEYAELVDFLK